MYGIFFIHWYFLFLFFYLVNNITYNIKQPCFPPPRIMAFAELENDRQQHITVFIKIIVKIWVWPFVDRVQLSNIENGSIGKYKQPSVNGIGSHVSKPG